MITEYVKDKKGNKIGFMIGFRSEEGPLIGYSKYNASREVERFNKDKAMKIAIGRAFSPKYIHSIEVPFSMVSPLHKFAKRCEKYFKSSPINYVSYEN